MRRLGAFLLLATAAAAPAATGSDLPDYALSACLIKQTASPELQNEGYHLADVVLERTHASPLAWRPLETAVVATLARRGMMMAHVDGPVAQSTRPAPLASCRAAIVRVDGSAR